MNALGQYIREGRLAAGCTSLRSGAEMVGLSHSYLDQLEKGLTTHGGIPNPSTRVLLSIARAFGLDFEHMVRLATGDEGEAMDTPGTPQTGGRTDSLGDPDATLSWEEVARRLLTLNEQREQNEQQRLANERCRIEEVEAPLARATEIAQTDLHAALKRLGLVVSEIPHETALPDAEEGTVAE